MLRYGVHMQASEDGGSIYLTRTKVRVHQEMSARSRTDIDADFYCRQMFTQRAEEIVTMFTIDREREKPEKGGVTSLASRNEKCSDAVDYVMEIYGIIHEIISKMFVYFYFLVSFLFHFSLVTLKMR